MVKIKARRGQFLVLTAFLVVVVLSSAIVLSYKRIQENQNIEPVVISSKLVDLHNSLNEMLSFTVGYYGSLIQVTGDLAYAQEKTQAYLESGLQSISRSNIDWGTSFELTTPPSPLENPNIHTDWFVKSSKTEGDITIKYDIPSLGLKGVEFKTYVALNVEILETSGGNAKVKITKDYDRIDLSLLRSNFRFFKYASNQWDYKDLESDPTITTSGEYLVPIPAGIYANAYNLQVVDNRGLMVAAGYVKGEGFENKPTTSYEFSFTWPNEHNSLSDDTPIVVELHQDGSLWWMGENILPFSEKPIPPVPVKGIHVSQTNQLDVTAEVPFQVEDWGSNYQVPYGIASAKTIFNENCMIVFLVNHNVKKVTIWWDGRDIATQPSTATTNLYFLNDDAPNRKLTNGIIQLDFRLYDLNNYIAASTLPTPSSVTTETRFFKINTRDSYYGAPESYIIYKGIVRDIIQQEPEYIGGIVSCPDLYTHLVITLPAKANYYTFKARAVFLSTSSRSLTAFELLQMRVTSPTSLSTASTESNINRSVVPSGVPEESSGTPIIDGTPDSDYDPHWSQFRVGNLCAGVIFTNSNNEAVFTFNDGSPTGLARGVIEVITGTRDIFLRPIRTSAAPPATQYQVTGYTAEKDLKWSGAVALNDSSNSYDTVYYPGSSPTGLWILVEKLPTITVK